ncbi:MAG: hypothetical protein CMA12_07775 [Euryarchaeota archaeon]|nr:hypothetical protein [Euryarchaeota archaeon]
MASTISKLAEGNLFRQGGEVTSLIHFLVSNVPVLCANHEPIVKFKDSKIVDKWFDDSITFKISDSSAELPDGKRIEKPNFRWESQTLGYVHLFDTGKPFEDLPKFDVVKFLQHQGTKMYPEILDNPSFMDPYFLNGTVDILQQKTILAGKNLFAPSEPGSSAFSGEYISSGKDYEENLVSSDPYLDIGKPSHSKPSTAEDIIKMARSLLEEEYVNSDVRLMKPFNEYENNFLKINNPSLEYRDPSMFKILHPLMTSGSNGPIPRNANSSNAGWYNSTSYEPTSIAFLEFKR